MGIHTVSTLRMPFFVTTLAKKDSGGTSVFSGAPSTPSASVTAAGKRPSARRGQARQRTQTHTARHAQNTKNSKLYAYTTEAMAVETPSSAFCKKPRMPKSMNQEVHSVSKRAVLPGQVAMYTRFAKHAPTSHQVSAGGRRLRNHSYPA